MVDRSPSEIARILRAAKDRALADGTDLSVSLAGTELAQVVLDYTPGVEPEVPQPVAFVRLTRAGRAALGGRPWAQL